VISIRPVADGRPVVDFRPVVDSRPGVDSSPALRVEAATDRRVLVSGVIEPPRGEVPAIRRITHSVRY